MKRAIAVDEMFRINEKKYLGTGNRRQSDYSIDERDKNYSLPDKVFHYCPCCNHPFYDKLSGRVVCPSCNKVFNI